MISPFPPGRQEVTRSAVEPSNDPTFWVNPAPEEIVTVKKSQVK